MNFSPETMRRFEELYAQGWDACAVTGKLRPPEAQPAGLIGEVPAATQNGKD